MFKFFKKPAFGLDISDYSIEVISLKGTIETPRLLSMGRTVLEPGIVEDGKILNKKKLEGALQTLVEKPKFGKIKTRKLIFALPESKSFIHIADLPEDLKGKEESEYIKFQAAQFFPFPLQDLYLDYKTRKRDNLKEVVLAASPRNIVNEYLEVFKSLRLQPICLEIESISLGRSLVDTKQPVLVVDIGARTTNFSLFVEGELRASFVYGIAGNQFTKTLAENLGIAIDEAETLKKEAGLNPKLKEGKIFLVLQKEIQKIIWEIRKIEEYSQEKEDNEIQKIILAGGSALLPHLPEYFTQNLEKPVAIGDPWVKINIDVLKKKKYLEKALEISPILYANCIGSASRALLKKPKTTGINLIK